MIAHNGSASALIWGAPPGFTPVGSALYFDSSTALLSGLVLRRRFRRWRR